MALFECLNSGGGCFSNYASGTFTYDGTNTVTVNVGFKPKMLFVYDNSGMTNLQRIVIELASFCPDEKTLTNIYGASNITPNGKYLQLNYLNNNWNGNGGYYSIKSITDTGFTTSGYGSAKPQCWYEAWG